MRSVLHAPSDGLKAYNLFLVCFGAANAVNEAVSYLQMTFRTYVSGQSIRLYDQNTLWKAEAEPNRLLRAAVLSFQTVRPYACKNYSGFIVPCDMDRLYAHLFSSPKDERKDSTPCPYYSKQMLRSILNGDFRKEEKLLPVASDFEISYQYEILGNGTSYAKISCHLNEICTEDPVPYLLWCDSVIREMDRRFPNCFRSAYISCAEPGLAVLHEQTYRRYDLYRMDRFLLGSEWSVYASNGILREAGKDGLPFDVELASPHPLLNGWQYRANIDIDRFDEAWRERLHMALQDMLMPAYGVYSWSEIWARRKSLPFFPQTVHVFYDPYNANDPLILFSHGLRSEQIRSLNEVQNAELMDGLIRKTT